MQLTAWLPLQVLLPAGPDAQQLPAWIFERSPTELKAAAAAARKRQELEQVRSCPPASAQHPAADPCKDDQELCCARLCIWR